MMADMAGALALVGSGEYTAAMDETDSLLLRTLGPLACPRVAVIPTASALEPGQPERWNGMGVAHFAALGAEVTPLLLLRREEAASEPLIAALRRQDLFYFSGGNPEYLTETWRGTPAWGALRERHVAGAVVAGCSAGAMMLGACFLSIRALRSGQAPRWIEGLGLAPGLAVLPHFDRARLMTSEAQLRAALATAPAGVTPVGVDEDTAIVRLPGGPPDPPRWQVIGRQTVSVFGAGGVAVYRAGETFVQGS